MLTMWDEALKAFESLPGGCPHCECGGVRLADPVEYPCKYDEGVKKVSPKEGDIPFLFHFSLVGGAPPSWPRRCCV